MALNCVWYGLAASFIVAALQQSPSRLLSRWGTLLTVSIFCMPFGWQNALWGLQSHTYLCLLTASITLWAQARRSSCRLSTCITLAACFVGIFSTAAGLITPLALLLVRLLLCVTKKESWRSQKVLLPSLFIICLVGFLLRVPDPAHDYLRAKTFSVFFKVLGSCLAWPGIDQPFGAFVMYLPIFLFCFQKLRSNSNETPTEWMIVFLPATLALLTAIGIAYARGNGLPDGAPLSRYQEMLAVGAISNASALLLLKPKERKPRHWRLLLICWLGFFALGATRLTLVNLYTHLPFKAATNENENQILTAYARTLDFSLISEKSLFEIGHTDPHVIERVMTHPRLKSILPAPLSAEPPANILATATRWFVQFSPILFVVSVLSYAALFLKRRERNGDLQLERLKGGQ
ncbi:MAG: hypothetical protein QM790_12970 [Nibricoccus sp.]